jgi:hypothetical protein
MISGAKTLDDSMVPPSWPTIESDEVVRLREWGTDKIHVLPQPPCQGWRIGTSPQCPLHMDDIRVSPTHADLTYQHGGWWIRDLGSVSEVRQRGVSREELTSGEVEQVALVPGLRQDGVSRQAFELVSGVEVGIGGTTLIAESPRSIALRDFCARLLGFGDDYMPVVDHALRAIRLAAGCRCALILRGKGDLVPIAYALHRHTRGVDAPFVVCDPRRRNMKASVRSPANYQSGLEALREAARGTLCMRSRLPHDFAELVAGRHDPDPRVGLIVCPSQNDPGEDLAAPLPIYVPPLSERASELPRIVEEYAAEAIAALRPLRPEGRFTAGDLRWVVECAGTSLPEIEKATLRVVALHMSANLSDAARLLGMAPVSLARWLGRHSRPPTANASWRRS